MARPARALSRSAAFAVCATATCAAAAPEARAVAPLPVTATVTRSTDVALSRPVDAAGEVRIDTGEKANVTASAGLTTTRGGTTLLRTPTTTDTTIFVTVEY